MRVEFLLQYMPQCLEITAASEKSISIKSDGKMEKDPAMMAPKLETLDDFLNGCRLSGIVGLGGAAYPLHGKWEALRKNKIETILINGAECEPYCTADNRTMVEDSDHIKKGIEILKSSLVLLNTLLVLRKISLKLLLI